MIKILKKCLPIFIYDLLQKDIQKKSKEDILKKVNDIIETDKPVLIEIGSGPRKGQNGFLSIDILPGCDLQLNLLEKLPFPDNSIDFIYSSHFLEHFQTLEIKSILKECYRILKPGGKISSVVPDASIYIKFYINNEIIDEGFWIRYLPAGDINSKIDYINYIGHMNGEHKHLFDLENLIAIHKACGFQNTKPRQFDFTFDVKEREYESLYIEAIK